MRNRNVLTVSLAALLLLSALATPGLAAPITFANAVLADNPIAYWRFGEAAGAATAADAAIGHDGTYFPGVTAGQAGIGGGDTGALFDGITGSVTVPNDPELGPNLVTMEALVRWEGPNGFQQRILEKSFFAGGEQASYGMSILDNGAVQVEVRSGGAASNHTTLQTLMPGDEAYVVGVYDGTFVFIYLDGLLLTQTMATPGALQDGVERSRNRQPVRAQPALPRSHRRSGALRPRTLGRPDRRAFRLALSGAGAGSVGVAFDRPGRSLARPAQANLRASVEARDLGSGPA